MLRGRLWASGFNANQTFNENAGLISDLNIGETNLKEIRTIYLNTIAKGDFNFSDSEKGILKSIALQCPLSGGEGVYHARSIYSLIAVLNYDQSCLDNEFSRSELNDRASIAEAKRKQLVEKPFVSISPNPANNEVVITFGKVIDSNTKILLYDFFGNLVNDSEMVGHQTMLNISTSNLPSGVYLCKGIDEEGETLFAQKLIIIH